MSGWISYMVVERGRRFKANLQSLAASLRHLSPLLEIVRFTSQKRPVFNKDG